MTFMTFFQNIEGGGYDFRCFMVKLAKIGRKKIIFEMVRGCREQIMSKIMYTHEFIPWRWYLILKNSNCNIDLKRLIINKSFKNYLQLRNDLLSAITCSNWLIYVLFNKFADTKILMIKHHLDIELLYNNLTCFRS